METLVYGAIMLFHNHLEKLLGSKTKIKILRVAFKFPGKNFTTRELSKLTGVSHTGVLKALKNLEEMNILHIETFGRANMVGLNKESFLAKHLQHIFKLERETVNNLVEDIKKSFSGFEAVSIAIFGSLVKGNEEPRSDIDLLIITEDKKGAEERAGALQEKLARKFGNSVSPHILSPREFKKGGAFRKDVLNHHIMLSGRRLEDI
jgi:predicted nucleotidyltransferase